MAENFTPIFGCIDLLLSRMIMKRLDIFSLSIVFGQHVSSQDVQAILNDPVISLDNSVVIYMSDRNAFVQNRKFAGLYTYRFFNLIHL